LFCDTALAGRIERAETQLIAGASEAALRRQEDTAGRAGFVTPIAGGVASFAEAGSPFNKVAGLGFGGVPDTATLDEIAHRRRGIQTALLSARLADAAAAGCDIAVVTTQPGSKSQQNVQRQGFDLLYTRAVLIKEP
jgi:hypothetical protein